MLSAGDLPHLNLASTVSVIKKNWPDPFPNLVLIFYSESKFGVLTFSLLCHGKPPQNKQTKEAQNTKPPLRMAAEQEGFKRQKEMTLRESHFALNEENTRRIFSKDSKDNHIGHRCKDKLWISITKALQGTFLKNCPPLSSAHTLAISNSQYLCSYFSEVTEFRNTILTVENLKCT